MRCDTCMIREKKPLYVLAPYVLIVHKYKAVINYMYILETGYNKIFNDCTTLGEKFQQGYVIFKSE